MVAADGVFGGGLGVRHAAAGADAHKDEQASARGAERDAYGAVQADGPGPKPVDVALVCGDLVGPKLQAVLVEVVEVALLEDAQELRPGPEGGEVSAGDVEADLEVDEVGMSLVADDEVFTFVEVDVSDVAGVHLGQGVKESREEVVGDFFISMQGVAGNEEAGHRVRLWATIDEDIAGPSRHARHVVEFVQEHGLALRQRSAEPAHGDAQDRLDAVELADDASSGAVVEGGGGPGVVLELFQELVADALDLDDGGRVLSAQGAEQGGAWPSHADMVAERV